MLDEGDAVSLQGNQEGYRSAWVLLKSWWAPALREGLKTVVVHREPTRSLL